MLASAMVIFRSIVNTCEAVPQEKGHLGPRHAIREAGFLNDPPLLPASLAGVVHSVVK